MSSVGQVWRLRGGSDPEVRRLYALYEKALRHHVYPATACLRDAQRRAATIEELRVLQHKVDVAIARARPLADRWRVKFTERVPFVI